MPAAKRPLDRTISYESFLRERRKLQALLLSVAIFAATVSFALASVIYAQDANYSLAAQQYVESCSSTAREQSATIDRERKHFEGVRLALDASRSKLEESRSTIRRLEERLSSVERKRERQVQEYEKMLRERDEELRDVAGRIEAAMDGTGEDGPSRPGTDEITSGLRRAVDRLSLRLDQVTDEKEKLNLGYRDLARHSKQLANSYGVMQQKYFQTTSMFHHTLEDVTHELDALRFNNNQVSDEFQHVLQYVQRLQSSSERQHSVILDLTAMVHSLHSSLQVSREDLKTQATESMYAVEAIAGATNEYNAMRAAAYELERAGYMQYMEMRLERLEDEALGAVQAVADAAGKLEYERKLEEEERWRSYAREAESILAGMHDNMYDEGGEDGPIFDAETSVLKTAISRRIEAGIKSLRRYVHPSNYLNRREEDVAKIPKRD